MSLCIQGYVLRYCSTIGNQNKLQYEILRQSLGEAASLLGNMHICKKTHLRNSFPYTYLLMAVNNIHTNNIHS